MGGYTLAVDYGTSNTVAALRHADGRVRPLLFDGSPLLASAVFAEDDGLVVGRDATHSARLGPSRFEPHPKRCIDDLEVLLGNRVFSVPDLVAAAFRRIATEAEQVGGGPPARLVLTHPAEWGAARRAVLLDAARTVGWARPTLVPEPVAAASYFGEVLERTIPVGSSLVVYDFGAGTFEVSVVERTATGYRTLSYRGVEDLGGVDFEHGLFVHVGEVFAPRAPGDWKRLSEPESLGDRRDARLLRDDLRAAKERLSRASIVTLPVPLIGRDVSVSRAEFDEIALPLVRRTVEVTRATVRAARVSPEKIAGVFLVGGSSRIPLVSTELHRALGIAPTVIEQPEIVVAEGALHTAPAAVEPEPLGTESTSVSSEGRTAEADPSVPPTPPDARRAVYIGRRKGIRDPSLRWLARNLLPLIAALHTWLRHRTEEPTSEPASLADLDTSSLVRSLEFNADGIVCRRGMRDYLIPWPDIHAIETWKPGWGALEKLVAIPTDAVAVTRDAPWKRNHVRAAGGIVLGTLDELETTEAEVLAAVKRTRPGA